MKKNVFHQKKQLSRPKNDKNVNHYAQNLAFFSHFLPEIAFNGVQKSSIVRKTIIVDWANYIPLESSFPVDSKNGIVFIFRSIFGHFLDTFLKKQSEKFVNSRFIRHFANFETTGHVFRPQLHIGEFSRYIEN